MKTPHIPTAILTHDGKLIIAAAKNDAAVTARLPDGYVAAADTLCTKVSGDISTQKTAKGELGNLTTGQVQNLKVLHNCMTQARKTARLAFPGQTVKWHQEFQIGVDGKDDLGSYLGRVDIVLGSINNAANLAAFKLKGWTDAETSNFQTARSGFGPAEQYRVKQISGAKNTTAQKNADAATLYENILTIQNAADLEHPATDPANAGVRGEFQLGIFPPDHGGNHAPPAQPAPQTKPK
jgi:hypothetical protein